MIDPPLPNMVVADGSLQIGYGLVLSYCQTQV